MADLMLTGYDSIGPFYERVYDFLAAREAEHNLIFGICSLQKDPGRFDEPPCLALVERGHEIVAVAVRTPPFNLVLSHVTDPAALDLIAGDAHRRFEGLPGVVAPKEHSRAFAEHWSAISGQAHQIKRLMRIYRLTAVCPVRGVAGQARPAGPADRAVIGAWARAFQIEIGDEPPTDAQIERMMTNFLDRDEPDMRCLFLWEVEGHPVAMTAYTGPTPHGMRINLVYTPPELRRRGYASALVAAVSQHLLDNGRAFCFLFTDLQNPTSNHIYQDIGYEPVCDVDEYKFE